jgi:ABC-type Mn2+/Zn2+ transport system permease subunit
VVALATLAYFSGVHARFRLPAPVARMLAVIGSRECMVGVLFAVGCVLPAWSMDPVWNSPASPVRLLGLPTIYFSALAWLNVRAITHWEAAAAKRSGLRVGQAVLWLALAGVAVAAWLLPVQSRAAALVAAGTVSALLIGWLDRRQTLSKSASQRVSKSALTSFDPVTVRAAVDLVLMTPLVLAAVALVR